jgi:ATP-dependent Lhr-like helicase
VRTWFERRFPAGPTAPQAAGWREISAGHHTLIAAPTGSGKTLAAFAVCIDRMCHAASAMPVFGDPDPGPAAGPQVVYVSPLKALAVDIQQNLDAPLREIAETGTELGCPVPDIKVAVRTGDTGAAARAAMLRKPPDFLVTTPESLYLLVTSERSRQMLRSVRTVIVDEIHAVAGNKRGSHLAITLERLSHVADGPVQRIGLSATQRPIETVARLLVGAGPERSGPGGAPLCKIVDSGHRRELDLALQLPDDELEAVASTDQMAQILDMIAAQVEQRKTTLVFVNTRRMSERVAHQLGERLGEDQVAAHHGSLSAGRRQRVEARLRAGDLRALVATASLELGIDVGPVELVCQIGSPRSFATFLQRVGRSNHTLSGVPTGRLYPTTRDELVECAALLRGVKAGRLDAIIVPQHPLDIVAQQAVAEVRGWAVRADHQGRAVRRAAQGGVRRGRRDGVGGHPHRPRPPRRLPAPRPGERAAAGQARRADGRTHLRRGHPRAGRLPGHRRAGRDPGRHGQRGLGRGEHGRRRVPARHHVLADPQGGAGHGPRGGRARGAAVGAVLAG